MKSQRRAFTPEFKDEAVKLVVNTGRPVATVARELGIVEQTLSHWANRARHLRNAILTPECDDSTCRLNPCPRRGGKAKLTSLPIM
jgi:transposase-like protein